MRGIDATCDYIDTRMTYEYVKLLKCKNIWSKNHDDLSHLLTYEVKYRNGRIDHINLTVDSPLPLRHFEVHSDFSYGPSDPVPRYLRMYTSDNDIMITNVEISVVKEADPVEMTVEEIEAALGKKIKIVTKE